MKWCRQQISFRFRIHTIEEMKINMPTKWLTVFSIIYLLVGISIIICQALILSNEAKEQDWWLPELSGLRFAYGAVLILTGIFCVLLMTIPKKRTSTFFCFIFAIASLVLASFGCSEAMWDYNRHIFEPRNIEVRFSKMKIELLSKFTFKRLKK